MNAASALSLANYRLNLAGPDGRFGTRDDRAIRIRSVQYDAASITVTIRPIRRLPLRETYLLTILGKPTTGLKDNTGLLLDGRATGLQGTNYVTRISDKSLVPPYQASGAKRGAVDHSSGIVGNGRPAPLRNLKKTVLYM